VAHLEKILMRFLFCSLSELMLDLQGDSHRNKRGCNGESRILWQGVV
jgi:hypothetical protein